MKLVRGVFLFQNFIFITNLDKAPFLIYYYLTKRTLKFTTTKQARLRPPTGDYGEARRKK
jgi:hypothetical protein